MTVAKHVVTHAHIDHVGGMRQIAATTGAPIQIGAAEREAAQTGQSPYAAKLERPGIRRIARRLSSFEPFPIERTLVEGDDIGFGFTVIDTPGHAPGHISLWRPQDRTLLAGDVIAGMSPLTGRRASLYAPPNVFSINADLHLVSARRLAALEPDTVCFGHGPPLRLGTRSLRQFVDQL
jgi:glyoxylase-like metal-dependent hydrolase (beta-lactamase superfamily II)